LISEKKARSITVTSRSNKSVHKGLANVFFGQNMVGFSNPSIYASSWQTKSGESLTKKKKKEKLETSSPGKRILLQQIQPGDKKNLLEIYILGGDMLVF